MLNQSIYLSIYLLKLHVLKDGNSHTEVCILWINNENVTLIYHKIHTTAELKGTHAMWEASNLQWDRLDAVRSVSSSLNESQLHTHTHTHTHYWAVGWGLTAPSAQIGHIMPKEN